RVASAVVHGPWRKIDERAPVAGEIRTARDADARLMPRPQHRMRGLEREHPMPARPRRNGNRARLLIQAALVESRRQRPCVALIVGMRSPDVIADPYEKPVAVLVRCDLDAALDTVVVAVARRLVDGVGLLPRHTVVDGD